MKIGISNPLDNIERLSGLGFDYMESQLFALMEMSRQEYDNMALRVKSAPIKCPVLNMYFRPGPFKPGPTCMKIVGPETDPEKLRDYSDRAADRAAGVGAELVVIGNGKSRDIPEGWTKEQAQESFMGSLAVMGGELGKRGITLVIEPVRFEETNNINRVDEGAELVRRLNHPSVKLLADFWHMRMVGEDISDIEQIGDVLMHTHIARKDGRVFPTVRDEDIYDEFFAALKTIGYKGRLSLEATTEDLDGDAPKSINLLRSMAAEYGL